MKAFNPDNYKRLFEFWNYPFFYDTMWLQSYEKYNGLCINVGGLRTAYVPLKDFSRTLKLGKKLYGNRIKLAKYLKEFDKIEKEVLAVVKNISSGKPSLLALKRVTKKWFRYYAFTDFLFTNSAQKEIEKNFPEFGRYKEDKRAFINSIGVGENSYLIRFLKSYADKLKIPLSDMLLYSIDEIIIGKKINVLQRKDSVLYYKNGKQKIISGKDALSIAAHFRKNDLKKGIVANKGRTKGRAFVVHNDIINTSQLSTLINNMHQGDIFIAETTSPELILFCKKASAIVTNQGGVMSHAATTSRELGIPCVVGLENATKYFHTGDIVEVDAYNGVVRKI